MANIRFERPCSVCGVVKSLADFPRNRSRVDGHAADCKDCSARRLREYRATPRGQVATRESRRRSAERAAQAYDEAVAKLSPAEQEALGWTGPRYAAPTP
ncbi:hypothetical protein MIAR_10960 [Microbacterium arabinogalactanolyticum]|nr:hypothetical protein MIAR_10960 [Microbacterium arabinogalactanolyticum]